MEMAFKLKANFFPMTVIKFFRLDQRSVGHQLKEIQRTAPNYFNHSPVILDVLEAKRPAKGLDLAKLVEILREFQMVPVSIQGLSVDEEQLATEAGLALWRSTNVNKLNNEEPTVAQTLTTKSANIVITKPVRSGMKVYAKDSNLVLLAPVSSGAECVADGDIFCYAPIRGRILAGASGDLQAQIFCHSLEAELIAISGYYLLYDECPDERTGQIQISLKGNKIQINNFSLERSALLCQK